MPDESNPPDNEQPIGTLRVATVDDLALHVLPPVVAKFRAQHPHVTVEVDVRESFVDLSKNDADIALRFGRKSPDGDVMGRRLLSANLARYASRAYLREHGTPKTLDGMITHAGAAGLDAMLALSDILVCLRCGVLGPSRNETGPANGRGNWRQAGPAHSPPPGRRSPGRRSAAAPRPSAGG